MEFLQKADYRVVGLSCACCDGEIEKDQAVYFDVDGERDADGHDRTSITVLHGWCYEHVQRARAAERAATLVEAAQNVRASATVDSAHASLMVKAREAHGRVLEMVA